MKKQITFVDLFCGIGGFHLAMKQVFPESKCIGACDIDPKAREIYEKNFNIVPHDDIRTMNMDTTVDIMCGGFPCQAFSIAQWKQVKAFDDPRGTLFFEILRLIDQCKPMCILLENVYNLTKIKNGEVFRIICNSLVKKGYKISHKVFSPHQFGIPQNRQRVYIVALRTDFTFCFDDIPTLPMTCSLNDILETNLPTTSYISTTEYVLIDKKLVKQQQSSGLIFAAYLKGNLRKKGIKPDTEHLSRVHKQLFRIYRTDGTHPTLSASESSGRYYILESMSERVRKLTLNECYTLMSFPPNFIRHVTKGVAYRHIGNSVCVKVVSDILKSINYQVFTKKDYQPLQVLKTI